MTLNRNGCFRKDDVSQTYTGLGRNVILHADVDRKTDLLLATCLVTGRTSAAEMTPREGGYLLLYLIVSLL